MKKLFAILAIFGLLSVGLPTYLSAQDAAAEITSMAVSETDAGGFHQALKVKFIEGGAGFMALIVISLILGLAYCLERIIYLSLADVNPKALLEGVGNALDKGDIEGAKNIARNTRGPIASIAYQGLIRLDQGPDEVERAIVAYGGVQSGLLEKNLSWITLFIALAPSLGFLGTVVGMVQAFDDIKIGVYF